MRYDRTLYLECVSTQRNHAAEVKNTFRSLNPSEATIQAHCAVHPAIHLPASQASISVRASTPSGGTSSRSDGSIAAATSDLRGSPVGPEAAVAAATVARSNQLASSSSSVSTTSAPVSAAAVARNPSIVDCGKGHGWLPTKLTEPVSMRTPVSSKT